MYDLGQTPDVLIDEDDLLSESSRCVTHIAACWLKFSDTSYAEMRINDILLQEEYFLVDDSSMGLPVSNNVVSLGGTGMSTLKLDPNILSAMKDFGRSDRVKILCSRCRRETTKTVEE